MNAKTAPVAIIAYNRLWHLRQTVEALLENPEACDSDLYIFSDGPKNSTQESFVGEVRSYIKTIRGFRNVTIVEHKENLGLAKSVIHAVNYILRQSENIIVLEDDLVTSKYFLEYMNSGLQMYRNDYQVASIHGYFYNLKMALPNTFFLRGADCLGWGTWRRAWAYFETDGNILLKKLEESKLAYMFDLDGCYPFTQMLKDQIAGKNNSWAVRWHASAFLQDMLTLHPGKSFVRHIGNDGSGTNFGSSDMLDTELVVEPIQMQRVAITEDEMVRSMLKKFLRAKLQSIKMRDRAKSWMRRIKKIITRKFFDDKITHNK